MAETEAIVKNKGEIGMLRGAAAVVFTLVYIYFGAKRVCTSFPSFGKRKDDASCHRVSMKMPMFAVKGMVNATE